MTEIHKTVTIDAPADTLFEIVDNPENFPRYVPNVSQVADVRRTEGWVGDTFRVTYRVLGITFDERFTTTDYHRLNRITTTFEGGMSGTFRWGFEPLGAQTKVNVDIDYRLVGGAVGKAVDVLVLERANEKSIDEMLQNLRRIAEEAGAPAPSS